MSENDISVIKRLLRDAESYVEALREVEATLQRQSNSRVAEIAPPSSQDAGSTVEGTQERGGSGNTGVKARVGEIIRQSGSVGMRPRDIAITLHKEFTFRNRQTAAAAVSSAIQRFKVKGEAMKTDNGRYVWVEK